MDWNVDLNWYFFEIDNIILCKFYLCVWSEYPPHTTTTETNQLNLVGRQMAAKEDIKNTYFDIRVKRHNLRQLIA